MFMMDIKTWAVLSWQRNGTKRRRNSRKKASTWFSSFPVEKTHDERRYINIVLLLHFIFMLWYRLMIVCSPWEHSCYRTKSFIHSCNWLVLLIRRRYGVFQRDRSSRLSLSKPNGVLKNHIISRLQIHTHTYRDVMYVFTQQQQQQKKERISLATITSQHILVYI